MREAEQEVMRGMVNDTWPGTAEDDMSEAMSRIDTSDPTVGARIMATAFAQRSNTYYCRGMGGAGKGILKTTPGFQRKGAAGASSSNSQTTRLQDQFECLQSGLEAQRAREMAAMAESYAASNAAHMERVNEVTNANQAAMGQWMTACIAAHAAGLDFPPMPTPIPLPQWPHPQWPQPQQQPPQPDQPPPQPQDPPNGNDELDFEFLLHRQMD